jgi:glyoxylase-like metal-dependent hydrolase (beta-lactamase superfamily II)
MGGKKYHEKGGESFMMNRIGFLFACFIFLCAGSSLAGQAARYETTKITDGVYLFRFLFNNGLFVVGNDAVLAMDPISVEAAKVYVEEIKKVTPKPVRYLVYSHHHFDHISGGAAFGKVEIIAHEKAKERLEVLKNPNIPLPTSTFSDRKVIDLGGKTVELIYAGKSHSDNMIVAYLRRERILFTVDFISNRSVGFMNLPDSYFPDTIEALKKVSEIDFDTLLFGHGPPAKKEVVRESMEYYTDLLSEVRKLVSQGLSLDDIKQKVSLPKYESWTRYKEWLPLNAERLYWHVRLGW